MKRRMLMQQGLAGLVAGALPLTALLPARAASPVKVGLLIPISGPAALFGPSSRDCGELAVQEINARGGLAGRPIELLVGDAGLPPADTTQIALKLWKGQGVEAFIGMHDRRCATRWRRCSAARCRTSTRRSTRAANVPRAST